MARCHFVVDRDPMSAVIQGAAGPVPCPDFLNKTGKIGKTRDKSRAEQF